MTPPCHRFPASALSGQVQLDEQGKKRKPAPGQPFDIDLRSCELLAMMQYSCGVDRPEHRDSIVRCWPVQRLFRRCQDRNGSFMVETTAWEGNQGKSSNVADSHAGAVHGDYWGSPA